MEYILPIEAGVGGRYAGVIVENDNISKQLLNKKSFSHFVTFYPLNKLRHRTINENQLRKAEEIAKKYDAKIVKPWDPSVSKPKNEKFRPVHMFCLGGFLICDNMDAASEISTHKDCRIQVVTTAGDVFDPTGEVSGGFRSEMNTPSRKWYTYQGLLRKREQDSSVREKNQAEIEEDLIKAKAERDSLLQEREKYARMADKLNRVREKIQTFRGQLTLGSSEKYAAQLPFFLKKKEQDKEECDRLEREIKSTKEMLNSLKTGKDAKSMFREKLDHIETEESNLKQEYESANRVYAEREAQIGMDLSEIDKIKTRITTFEKDISRLTDHLEERSKFYSSEETALEQMQAKLEQLKTKQYELQEKDEAIKKQLKDNEEKLRQSEEEIKKLSEKVLTFKSDIEKAKSVLVGKEHLLRQPMELNSELESMNLAKMEAELKDVKNKVFELSKQVNKDADSTRTRLEEQMQDLIKKEDILKENKEQIYTNLEHLDEKSQQSVLQCFEFVNK